MPGGSVHSEAMVWKINYVGEERFLADCAKVGINSFA
jgi:hypothetical protein